MIQDLDERDIPAADTDTRPVAKTGANKSVKIRFKWPKFRWPKAVRKILRRPLRK